MAHWKGLYNKVLWLVIEKKRKKETQFLLGLLGQMTLELGIPSAF